MYIKMRPCLSGAFFIAFFCDDLGKHQNKYIFITILTPF